MLRTIRRLVARIRYRHFEEDLERELAVHRAMLEQEAQARGASATQARYEAARQLGNTTLARETARGVWLAPWLEGLWQDLRFAGRSLRASPSFTLPALGVLIITMGLTTGVYATVESVLLRPWPVPDPHRVVAVHVSRPIINGALVYVGMVEYQYLREHARSLDLVASEPGRSSMQIGAPGAAETASVRLVSGNYFAVLRLPVAAGRPLLPADDAAGAASAVAVISHELWQRQFGGRSEVVGAAIRLNDVLFTVVGVASASTRDRHEASTPDAWIPLNAKRAISPELGPRLEAMFESAVGSGFALAGRLKPGIDRRTAEAEMSALSARFAALHDVTPLEMSITSTAYAHDIWARTQVQVLSLLPAAVLLMLLLGCANVGNLQLARGLSRTGELAVRLALGAPRGRLIRQSLLESLWLCVVSAASSLVIAAFVVPIVVQRVWPVQTAVAGVGWRAVLFASGLAVGACILAGVLPALSATRMPESVVMLGVPRRAFGRRS